MNSSLPSNTTLTACSPLLTVIVPVYNTAPYLRKCLDSICEQTYRNLEIICVDDGSTDGSLEILEEYASKDSRLRVLRQKHAMQAAARNLALSQASGEYMTCMDSDDYLDPTCYEKAMNGIQQGCDMAVFGGINVDEEGHTEEFPYYKVKFSGKINCDPTIHSKVNINIVLKIFKMSILKQYNITFAPGKWYEDMAFAHMYMSVIKTAYGIQETLYYRLVRSNSTMGQTRKGSLKALDYLDVLDQLFKFLKKNGMWDSNLQLIYAETKHATTTHYNYISDKKAAKRAYSAWVNKWNLRKLFPDADFLSPFAEKTLRSKLTDSFTSLFYKKTDTSERYSLFGLPLVKTTVKNGKVTTRILGIKVHAREV